MVRSAIEKDELTLPPLGLPATLHVPANAFALVVFAHGSGSSRLSPRNVAVADALNRAGMATLLFDLLKPEEEAAQNRAKVFDIALLGARLVDAVEWAGRQAALNRLPIGFFGASTGAAAAIVAAARLGDRVGAIVSRGGRPDLAGQALETLRAATLLIVGGADAGVIELNQAALARIRTVKAMKIVPGATHLFSEPGALEQVTSLASEWFERHLRTNPT